MVLDVSGSMNFCNIHGEDYELYTSGSDPAGTMYGCYGCGREHITETGPWYNKEYSCTIHGKGNIESTGGLIGATRYCDTCARDYTSRLKSLKVAAKAFTKSVIENKGENENISITLITFATDVKTGTTVKNPTVATVHAAIDAMTATGGTNMRQSIVAATNVFNGNNVYKGENTKNVLLFLSDGEPNSESYKLTNSAGTITNLNKVPNLEKFAVGLGDSFARDELNAIVGAQNTDRVYEATDTETLVEQFNAIADKIKSSQTANGGFSSELTSTENIYPVILSYTDSNSKQVEIIANNATELTENNVEISADKNITWDISKYPGCKDFVIKIGINGASNGQRMMKSRARVVNNPQEIVWTVVYKGDPNCIDTAHVVEEDSISNVLSAITEKVVNNEITEKNIEEVNAKVEEIDAAKNQPSEEEPVETTKPEETTEPTTTPEPTEEVKEPEATGEEEKKPTETPTTSEEGNESDANVTNSTEKPEESSNANDNTVENNTTNTTTEIDNSESETAENVA